MKIKQDDPGLISQIQQWGCYFLCLHYYIEEFRKLRFNIIDINNNYYRFIRLGYMNSSCYILEPCKILGYFSINTNVKREIQSYRCTSHEFEISEVKIKGIPGYHFIAINSNSVLYDSLELKERGKEYYITSKRIFRRV
ncbi:DUF261 family protein [Borrelia hermsii]|uniref:BppB n=2 Tax=Borrelia hermsii TaxID=140 RepID=A0AAN0X6T4_BORHE|nr:DUF261 family protein [Borrelia hermsii]AMR76027.1 hypothetical protein A0V01_05285 [Borrelia hermsii]ANA43862.1 hypothetical protein AXX13_B24 [Borrelia hermsii HS1]UPA08715.1 DUF261 family protein [Borrelia hermsii DAH]UVY98945.1 DUF261 family protein [Borrelia hermsii]